MISLTVNTSDVDRTLANLTDRHFLYDPMEAGLALLHDYMAKYPAQRPTRYRRTGNLGRRWTSRISGSGDGLVGELGNSTPYGPFVQDARRQARWHVGYWQTDEMAVRENETRIRGFFEDALQETVER